MSLRWTRVIAGSRNFHRLCFTSAIAKRPPLRIMIGTSIARTTRRHALQIRGCGSRKTSIDNTPIRRIYAGPHIPMKRRIRPIHRFRHIPVFHRVVVDVFDMVPEIVTVFDQMFPVKALPDAAFASRNPNHRTSFDFWKTQAEIRFDTTPASREIGIVFRQLPDPVHMIRQHHPSDDRKWTARSFERDTIPQTIEFRYQQIVAAPFQQVNREKPRPARRPFASIIRHARQHARIATKTASENSPTTCQKTPKTTSQA